MITLKIPVEEIHKAPSNDAIFDAFSTIVTNCYVVPELTFFRRGSLTPEDGCNYLLTLKNLINYLKEQCAAQKLDLAQVRTIVFCMLNHYKENKLGLPTQAEMSDKKAKQVLQAVQNFGGDVNESTITNGI